MKTLCLKGLYFLDKLRWLPLLCLRWMLAFGFFMPAMEKLNNFSAVVQWFATLNIPFPYLSAVLSTTFEVLGIFSLFFGLFTRLLTIPLMFLMGVAIFTVHWSHGFAASSNGFEIPFYYFLMLFTLFVLGPGGISIDAIIKNRWLKR